MKKTSKSRTYSVNIRKIAAERCGLTFKDQPMIDPVSGVLVVLGDEATMHLNSRISETHKRMAIAQALAVCIMEKEKINVIVGQVVPDEVAAIARRLMMPESSFRREELRLRNFGPMRFSILSTLFQVPLAEVMMRVHELGLADG